jgi:mRNA interferase MazF
MAINYHPGQGTIILCDYRGTIFPEMQKKRPVVVMCNHIHARPNLCTVVPLSTTPPSSMMPYHFKLQTVPPLPSPYDEEYHWVKADMIGAVAFERLSLPFAGKDASGKRIYDVRTLNAADFRSVQQAVLNGLGLAALTFHL